MPGPLDVATSVMSENNNRRVALWSALTSLLFGAVLTAIPVFTLGSKIGQLLARPGFWLSTILGANDRWGTPGLLPYAIGGIGFWGVVTFLACCGFIAL